MLENGAAHLLVHDRHVGRCLSQDKNFQESLYPPDFMWDGLPRPTSPYVISDSTPSLPVDSHVLLPITHLTVRIDREGWSQQPVSTPPPPLDDPLANSLEDLDLNDHKRCSSYLDSIREEEREGGREIALEPGHRYENMRGQFITFGERPCVSAMVQAAEERRTNYASETWGARIGQLWPDLKRFTLWLEVGGDIEAELKTIVECAKVWAFPIGSVGNSDYGRSVKSQRLLRRDGKIEASQGGGN